MDKELLEVKIDFLISKLDARNQKNANEYKDYFSNPRTIEHLLRILNFCAKNNMSDVITCLKFIGVLSYDGFFTLLIDQASKLNDNLFVEYALQENKAIPNDIKLVEKQLPRIFEVMKKWDDSKVYHQGISLVYRITKECPEIESLIPTDALTIKETQLKEIGGIINHLNEFYVIGFGKPSKVDLNSVEEFMNFTSEFTIVVNK